MLHFSEEKTPGIICQHKQDCIINLRIRFYQKVNTLYFNNANFNNDSVIHACV